MTNESQAVRELREAMSRLPEAYPMNNKIEAVIAELEAWRKGCLANSEDAKESHRRSDNQRLEILDLKAEILDLKAEILDLKAQLEAVGHE